MFSSLVSRRIAHTQHDTVALRDPRHPFASGESMTSEEWAGWSPLTPPNPPLPAVAEARGGESEAFCKKAEHPKEWCMIVIMILHLGRMERKNGRERKGVHIRRFG